MSTKSTSPRAVNPRQWQVPLQPSIVIGSVLLLSIILMAVAAPWLYTIDPNAMDPASSHLPPGAKAEFTTLAGDSFQRMFPLGTDAMGRDLWSRTAYGARVSLGVGLSVALGSMAMGLLVGLIAGYFRRLDGPVMRIMDGIMAIPGILFAIALVAVWRPSLMTVIIAIVIPETPRVARVVRSVVLSVREEPYVEAARALDTPTWLLIVRHILPNTLAPLIVQGTFICAAAMLIEAAMSFLGVGLPPDVPTWGNIMSEGSPFPVRTLERPAPRRLSCTHRAYRESAGRRDARCGRPQVPSKERVNHAGFIRNEASRRGAAVPQRAQSSRRAALRVRPDPRRGRRLVRCGARKGGVPHR
jgi:peptide/nickel transport system permease protein